MDRDFDPRRIKGVFFDLFGTIFTYGDMDRAWADWFQSMYASFTAHGLVMEEEDFDAECEGFFAKPVEPAARGRSDRTVFERRLESLGRRLGLELDDEAVTGIAESGLESWHREVRLDERIYAVLKELKGKKALALITNFDHPPHIDRLVREYALDRFFEQIIVSSAVGIWKPDPRVFRLALEPAGLKPEEVIYVGDSEKDDVAGARAAGLFPVLIRRPGAHKVRLDYARGFGGEAPTNARPIGVIADLTGIFKYL